MMTKTTDSSKQEIPQAAGYDDLTQIKGIGEVTQQWLRQTFSVRTYGDLARVSPDDLEERLKAGGKITARSKIQEWLAQARELAEQADVPSSPAADAERQEGWKTFSTFVVMFEERQVQGETQFQTKAHHMEADKTEAWPGLVPEDLTQWIIAQLGPKALQALMPAAAPSSPQEMQQVAFSEELSRYVSKAYQLAGEETSPHLQTVRQTPPQPEGASMAPSPAAYSGKLRQFITKARHLAGDE